MKTKKELKKYINLFLDYTELRIQENKKIRIRMLNGNVKQNDKNVASGVSARVYKNGVWGFSSTPEINDFAIKEIIDDATKNARFMEKRQDKFTEKKQLKNLSKTSIKSINDFSSKKKISRKVLLVFLIDLDNYIKSSFPDLISIVLYLECLDITKSLYTSDDSYSFSITPRTVLFVDLEMKHKLDNTNVELNEVFGGFGEFPDVFKKASDLFPKIDQLYTHLSNKANSIYPNAGIKDCIIDGKVTGLLIHESIGHTTEADLVETGSIAREYINQIVGTDLVTIVDFANNYKGKICPVPIFVDDEGTKCEDTVIVKNGILKSYMHNKESSIKFRTIPRGNARACEFSDEPLIRMRNTILLPGESKLEDMIASIKEGYYLMSPKNGQADITSEFMFGINLAYEIKDGKLGKALKDFSISGIGFNVLKTITMVSDNMQWLGGGMCEKKQLITVGMGGPAIKCKINIGGK